MRRSTFRPLSVAEIAERTSSGAQPFDPAVREFLDSWQAFSREERIDALAEEPPPLDAVKDAYLAALAEHLAALDRFDPPAWTEAPTRFLREPFFAGGLESLKATLIVESPSAFRRRLIFISAKALSRPRRRSSRSPAAPEPLDLPGFGTARQSSPQVSAVRSAKTCVHSGTRIDFPEAFARAYCSAAG
jgi:hypothetical protein